MSSEEELTPQETSPSGELSGGIEPLEPSASEVPVEATPTTAEPVETATTNLEPPYEPAADESVPEAAEEEKPATAAVGAPPRQLVGEPHPKKSFWAKVLPWVIVAVLFYLGGLATLFFAVYQPYKQAATVAAAEAATKATAAAEADADKIINLTNDYNQALKQYGDTQTELDLTKGELEAANATIADQQTEIARTHKMNIAYKFLVDVSSARAALEKQDTATARQAINFARADLAELKATDIEPASLSGFAEKLDDADKNLNIAGITRARTALDSLYANLLLLVDNLP